MAIAVIYYKGDHVGEVVLLREKKHQAIDAAINLDLPGAHLEDEVLIGVDLFLLCFETPGAVSGHCLPLSRLVVALELLWGLFCAGPVK